MIEGKWFAPGSACDEALAIRSKVFGRGRDALDDSSWNVIVWHEGQSVATGRIWWQDGAFYIGDIGVLEPFRHRRLGDLTLRLLLFKAETHAAREIRLFSPLELTGLFEKFNFAPVGTAANGIQLMSLKGEDLCLDTCQSCKKDCPSRHA